MDEHVKAWEAYKFMEFYTDHCKTHKALYYVFTPRGHESR